VTAYKSVQVLVSWFATYIWSVRSIGYCYGAMVLLPILLGRQWHVRS